MKIKVARVISDFLASKGITKVFTVTGGGAMHLNDAFGHHEKFECIYNNHEQACAMGAEGYARAINSPACICVTSGPGGTNAITGVMGAWLDSIPMFVVSGQVKFSTTMASVPKLKLRQLGDQEFNIVDAVKCMTKYSVMVTDPKDILYHLEKAYYLMVEGRKAPVWLDIPLNIQGAMVDMSELRHFDSTEMRKAQLEEVTDSVVDELLSAIKKAKKPVIFAGTAIRNCGYVDKFIEFCERLNIPVVTSWNAHDSMYDEHYLYAGRPGSIGNRGGNFVVQNSDLVLVIGSSLNIRQISYNYDSFAKNAYKIVVDFDKNELAKPFVKIDKAINSDLCKVIDKCLSDKNFGCDNHREWLKWAVDINNKYPTNMANASVTQGAVNPYQFMDKFSEFCHPDDTIITSNGSACVVTFQAFKLKKGQRLFTNSGCASMGYGLPAGIGGAVAKNGGRIICVEGDGSLQMNIQELGTLALHDYNLKLVVLNNNGYLSIKQTQTNLFKGNPLCGVNTNSGVGIPSLGKIAAAYELPYYKLNDISKMNVVMADFFGEKGACILEVIVDENQNFEPKLSSKVLPDGSMISPDIDDMFPFLDRDEYNGIKFEERV